MAAWQKLKHKQWRTVGVALTFNNSNSSKRNLWIDSLSQSWTNPMHLLQAFGSLTLSWSCLPLVCLWDCKFVSVPKFIYGYFWTCSCDEYPLSRSFPGFVLRSSLLLCFIIRFIIFLKSTAVIVYSSNCLQNTCHHLWRIWAWICHCRKPCWQSHMNT